MTTASEIGRRYHRFFDGLTAEQRRSLARTKRFIECWSSYPKLREGVAEAVRTQGSFDALWEAFGLEIVPADFIGLLGIPNVPASSGPMAPAARLWLDYLAMMGEGRQAMVGAGETEGANPLFDSWRRRQVARSNATLGQSASQITHPVIAFELSDGCSIGCWFCGISAARFAGNFDYAAHSTEWRAILQETQRFFGPAAQSGFCYWATDPSDNPDYGRFIADYADIIGVPPVTTTAAPLRDIDKTRSVIDLTVAARALPVRFSILTPRQLKEVHAAFSADELLHVSLVLQLQGTITPKSTAGRARTPRGGRKEVVNDDGSTIACVSGFLVNMPRRTVRLVTPVPPSETCPDGFVVLGERVFTDAAAFGMALRELQAAHMAPALRRRDAVQLRVQAHASRDDDGLAVVFGDRRYLVTGPHIDVLERALRGGDLTVAEMAGALQGDPIGMMGLSQSIGVLFDGGVLVEPWEPVRVSEPALESV